MKLLLTTALVTACFSVGLSTGATLKDNLTSLEYVVENADGEAVVDSTERTTILFSGFFLPSTAPPTTAPTTLFTVMPEKLDTTVVNEIVTEERVNPKQVDTTTQLLDEQTTTLEEKEEEEQRDISQNLIQPIKVGAYQEQAYHLESRRLIEDHPCRRNCSSTSPMICTYKFRAEWYESLSKACFNCPHNITDCYREDCIPTDGVQRPLVVVNRRFPGPTVEVCLGDTVELDLENRLMAETTSVHWHGLHQRGSPYMDGVPFVSQCPLMPHSTFTYRYTAANTGTHFWHSHSGTQRGDGMFGALIVRKPNDPHKSLYDEDLSEHVIQVTDWSHELMVAVFTGHHHSRESNKPPSILVNGRGIFGNMSSTSMVPPASFTVQQSKKYRFRLINAGVLNCPIELSIDNHTMIAISSDGSDIAPIEVESLVSYAGERWDFVLKANAPVGNYWMRFRGLMDCDERFTSAHTVAVLHYTDSNNELPNSPVGYMLGNKSGRRLNPLNEGEKDPSINVNKLQSLAPIDKSLKPTPDQTVVLSFDFHPVENPHLFKKNVYGYYQVREVERVRTPQINHVSLTLPPFPLLSQYSDLKHGMLCSQQDLSDCSKNFCECINVIDLNLGEVVELILLDVGDSYNANHPFHLHGFAFRVVAMDRIGNSTTVDEVLELETKGLIKRNLVDPPIKDTVTIPDGGYTVLRFVADNPGFWMLHCHLEFHVELGMALIFRVGEYSDFPPVPPNFPKCGNYAPPPSTAENEVYWSYNSSKTPDGKFTLTNWWPLRNSSNAAIDNKASLTVSLIFAFMAILV